ncbi:unnamed protein product [Darwinula stevensoni]|uniref:Lipase domain-containing protein n=1 Tax=Darwinula stevensoni TaxID=69355 RepID=A0A7R8X9T6_9CRUS|nr:unnamed protein product [Darwinula stevensoni]CAG0885947.1 unnamed protein product [Darwinula stevensoni]
MGFPHARRSHLPDSDPHRLLSRTPGLLGRIAHARHADHVYSLNGTHRELTRGDILSIFDNIQALQGLDHQIQQNLASAGKEKECHDIVGCFTIEGGAMSHLGLLPVPPHEVGLRLFLYTRLNPVQEQELVWNDEESIRRSNFRPELPTKVIVHGWREHGQREWMVRMKDAILAKEGDANVILAGWKDGARGPLYLLAATNTEMVGRMLGHFLLFARAEAARVHAIGFSLGAMTAGHLGEFFKERGQKLGRISGLDPAALAFTGDNFNGDKTRLDPSDAEFVDVIHTNGAPLIMGGLGAPYPLGHVDFYPNGGEFQPSCNNDVGKAVQNILAGKIGETLDGCNHKRAVEYYLESIASPCKFRTYPCPNEQEFRAGNCMKCSEGGCGTMGYEADSSLARGRQFLATTGHQQAFCGIQYQVWMKMAEGQGETLGSISIRLPSDGSVYLIK